jgi:hypothetical protein
MSAPTRIPGERLARWVPRTLATVLAVGGCFFGLLLYPWTFRGDVSPLAVAVFGPGYLITLGYIIRACSTPTLGFRRLLWSASLVIQGTWMVGDLSGMAARLAAGQTLNEPLLPTAWWIFATFASVTGILLDKPKPAARGS